MFRVQFHIRRFARILLAVRILADASFLRVPSRRLSALAARTEFSS